MFRILSLLICTLIVFSSSVFAAGPPPIPVLQNELALFLVIFMIILLIVIFVLGRVLMGLAEVKRNEEKEAAKKSGISTAVVTGLPLLISHSSFAQDSNAAVTASATVGGLSSFVFYFSISIILIELLVILGLIYNIKVLLRKDRDEAVEGEASAVPSATLSSWWSRMNRFKPVEQETELELDHEYDGIRELDNRLPPWWLYGFYATIIFGVIYLWRYHVSYSAPLSGEEYEISVKKADEQVKAYLAQKGETVDENTVTVSTDAADLEEGKKIYTTACVACHKADGGGMVGPNLTDDYWMHGGDIRSIFKTIKYGINAMPQWQTSYSNKQIAQVASYVMSLHGTNPPGAKAPEGELYKENDGAAPQP